MFGGPPHKRLEKLLAKLWIPYKFVHDGGNGSNFTLKTLLALTLRDCPSDKHCFPQTSTRKIIVQALSHMPIPPNVADHLKPIPFNSLESLDRLHGFQVNSDPDIKNMLQEYEYTYTVIRLYGGALDENCHL